MFKIIEMSFVIPRDQSVSELSSFRRVISRKKDPGNNDFPRIFFISVFYDRKL